MASGISDSNARVRASARSRGRRTAGGQRREMVQRAPPPWFRPPLSSSSIAARARSFPKNSSDFRYAEFGIVAGHRAGAGGAEIRRQGGGIIRPFGQRP